MRDGFEKAMEEVAVADSGPYRGSEEHLWDELRRIDQLVRARTVHWRITLGANKPEELWGMVHVTDREVEDFLRAPFAPPHQLPAELETRLAPYWQAAGALRQAIDERRRQTPGEVTLRLDRLQALFALSELERDVLLVCLLPEVDERYRRLFAYLRDDAARTRPTVELVLRILHPMVPGAAAGRAAFDPNASLQARRLIAVGGGEREDPLPARPVRLDDRIAAYLLGSDRPDDRLAPLLSDPEDLPGSDWLVCEPTQLERLQALAQWWGARGDEPDWGTTVMLHGPYGSGRLAAADAVCKAVDVPLLVIDVECALRRPTAWETLVELACREAMLRGAALYWSRCEVLLAKKELAPHWRTLMAACEGFAGMSFLSSTVAWDPAGCFRDRPFLRFDFTIPDHELRRQAWEARLPPAEAFAEPAPDLPALAAILANSFQLTGGQIADAAASAPAHAFQRDPEEPLLTVEDLFEGCRRQTSSRLRSFARRLEPRAELTFDDLVLPAANRRQLEELRTRIRYRNQVQSGLGFQRRLSLGKGLIVLFTGSSGTGKTMAAELLAREQGVDLYKIDLSNVVSKYVGETEKNLSSIFAQAENANAILLFDEADALFGKRGEVRDARDRWANLEVNYLLQRIEEYSGVVILTSNLRQNIDEAFVRRFQVIVEFPFPDAERRFPIWRSVFPSGLARPSDDEIRTLAERFRFSGAEIKNIVVDAAYRALADTQGDQPAITLRHLLEATVSEYQKTGKPVTKAEFGEENFALLGL